MEESRPGLDELTCEQLEIVVAETYRRHGFAVEMSVARGAQNESDITLARGNERIVVSCTDWNAETVSATRIEDFCRLLANGRGDSGVLVTQRKPDAVSRARVKRQRVRFVDRAALEEAIQDVSGSGENLCAVHSWLDEFLDAVHFVDAICPNCGNAMVLCSTAGGRQDRWTCVLRPLCGGERAARVWIADALAARLPAEAGI